MGLVQQCARPMVVHNKIKEKDLQLGTEYFFSEIGVRLWRERAFHPKLLKDPLYMEEMQAVLEDEYQYQYFQMVTIIG